MQLKSSKSKKFFESFNKQCFWCGDKLVRVAKLSDKIIKITNDKVHYINDNKVMVGNVATFDHVNPIIFNGKNTRRNCVFSCYPCNHLRNDLNRRFGLSSFDKYLEEWVVRNEERFLRFHGKYSSMSLSQNIEYHKLLMLHMFIGV